MACIQLVAGNYTLSAELLVSRAVIIKFATTGAAVLDGGGSVRVFNVNPASATEYVHSQQNAKSPVRCRLASDPCFVSLSRSSVELIGLKIANGVCGGGCGVLAEQGTVAITNCEIYGHTTTGYGAGLQVGGSSVKVVATSTVFRDNTGGSYGGSVYQEGDTSLEMIDCSFSSSSATGRAGGWYVHACVSSMCNNCVFGTGNAANTAPDGANYYKNGGNAFGNSNGGAGCNMVCSFEAQPDVLWRFEQGHTHVSSFDSC